MSSPNNWNQQIIDEFHANGGKVGGPFAGGTLLLLHTVGAKSNQPRINPLAYTKDGDNFIIIASKGGAPTNPDWYYNLKENPKAIVEVGTETFDVTANILTGEERDRLYAKQATIFPNFAQFAEITTRNIPVIALKRQAN